MDHNIPWESWINGAELPLNFTNTVKDKMNRKPSGSKLLLSISFLNSGRSDIMEDFNGNKPSYSSLSDSVIEEAYFKHVSYLVDELDPAYLVYSIESNDLFLKTPSLWEGFRMLMDNIGDRLKSKYPNLPMAESITLHNWYQSSTDPDYLAEIEKIANGRDFAAISFYPFFKGLHSKNDFQEGI